MDSIDKNTVLNISRRFGFDLCGFATVETLPEETAHLKKWLQLGYHADMAWMTKNTEKRYNVKEVFPDAQSVISLGMNYYTPYRHIESNNRGKISRYAWGKDYHLIIWAKTDELIKELQIIEPSFKAIAYVDTGPVMDKAWAVRAGLGWMGKHSNIINRKIGSWFFIATILTNKEFEPSEYIPDHCGTCTACIEACPTKAITSEYIVDSNKCISYNTIENKGEIDGFLEGKFGGWVFGCDICQDVCPWNTSRAVNSKLTEFEPAGGETSIDLDELLEMSEMTFKQKYNVSPIKRAKLKGMKRNALFLKK